MHVTIRGIRINPETGAETTWILGRIQEKVATGKSKTKTPLGSFMIRNRVEKPAWTERRSDGTIKRIVPYGGKDYPYGKEATVIQTDNKFDLHPVGKGLRTEGNFSHGCVRMNPHLARMLWLLIPLNTRGEVVDDRLAIEEPIYPINPGITPAIILSEQSI
jgi:Ykud domain.